MNLEDVRQSKIENVVDRVLTEKTDSDSDAWQILKENFIDDLMKNKTTTRLSDPSNYDDPFMDTFAYVQLMGKLYNQMKDELDKEVASYIMVVRGKAARESGHLAALEQTAPSIIYQPGSRWLPKPTGQWKSNPDRKAVFNQIQRLPKQKERAVLPSKSKIPEWKIICSQLGEYRKNELIHMAWQLGIGMLIDPNWDKSKICKIMSKQMAVL